MDNYNYATGTIEPWYARRWWLRSRRVKPIRYTDGSTGACAELYVPL